MSKEFVVWRILAPYLINIRKCPADEACNIMRDWLDRRSIRRRLDFNPNYTKKCNINSANGNGYLPISLEKLGIENKYRSNLLSLDQ